MQRFLMTLCATLAMATSGFSRDFRTAEVAMTATNSAQTAETDASPAGAGFDLTAPLPVLFLGGMVTLDTAATHEGVPAGGRSRSDLGLQYLHHAAEGVPQFRLKLQRKGSASDVVALPLVDSHIMIDTNDADRSWLKLPGFRTHMTIGLHDLRRGEKSLALQPTATLHFERKRRLLFQIETPTRLTVAYTGGSARQWAGFAEASKREQYFVQDKTDDPWVKTTETKVSAGMRHRLYESWFLSMQAGRLLRRGDLEYDGPWAEVAMQSWTSLP